MTRYLGVYPYVANSCWVGTTRLVKEALKRDDLYPRVHPFDEAPMNVLLWHEGGWRAEGEEKGRDARGRVDEGLCVVTTFAAHPSYTKGYIHEGIAADIHYIASDVMEKYYLDLEKKIPNQEETGNDGEL